MLEVLGKNYYIDVDMIIEKCKTDPMILNSEPTENGLVLNVFKYECFKSCMERILSDYDISEENVAVFQEKEMNHSFKIAFNTLLKNEIIIEDEDE
jgi:hypothetical protein